MVRLLIILMLYGVTWPVLASSDKFTTVDRLNRRTCPDSSCGVVGQLFYREKVVVYEEKQGWARISKYYDASCRGGKSDYVDTGTADCTIGNGIVDGKFSEWVSAKYISLTRPEDPSANAIGLEKIISGSDDFRIYKQVFVDAVVELTDSDRCTQKEIKQQGGFYKSSKYQSKPIYFIYCGGYHKRNKILLNASTGQLF